MDLQAKLNTVQALVSEVSVKKFPTYSADAVKTCIQHLHEAVEYIDADLMAIDKAIQDHREMLLRRFRPASYYPTLERLQEHVGVLDARIDRLLQMMSLTGPLSESFIAT